MSEISRHQSLLDLFGAVASVETSATKHIEAWQRHRGIELPRALREMYTTRATVSLGDDRPPWSLPLDRMWADFWHPGPSLDTVLADIEAGGTRSVAAGPPPTERPLIHIETDVMSIWHGFIELDGSDDPPVWTHCRDSTDRRAGWTPGDGGTYSEFMFDLAASSYVCDQVPWSIRGPEARFDWPEDEEDELDLLVVPYENGLWLRAVSEPFTPPVIDRLLETFPEGAVRQLVGDVTSYTLEPEMGTVVVTTDAYEGDDPRAHWWIYAWTHERLVELVRIIGDLGGVAAPRLRADTARARAVMVELAVPRGAGA